MSRRRCPYTQRFVRLEWDLKSVINDRSIVLGAFRHHLLGRKVSRLFPCGPLRVSQSTEEFYRFPYMANGSAQEVTRIMDLYSRMSLIRRSKRLSNGTTLMRHGNAFFFQLVRICWRKIGIEKMLNSPFVNRIILRLLIEHVFRMACQTLTLG